MNPNETQEPVVLIDDTLRPYQQELIDALKAKATAVVTEAPRRKRQIGAMLSVTGLLVAGIGNTAMTPEEMGKEGVEKIETANLNRKQRRARKAKKRRKGGR